LELFNLLQKRIRSEVKQRRTVLGSFCLQTGLFLEDKERDSSSLFNLEIVLGLELFPI
jgi:hypothetical protein